MAQGCKTCRGKYVMILHIYCLNLNSKQYRQHVWFMLENNIFYITFSNESAINFCGQVIICVTNYVHYRSDFGGTNLRKIWNESIKDSLNSIGNRQLRWWHIMNMSHSSSCGPSYFPNYISSWAGRWGGHSSGIKKPFNLAFLGHRCALRDSAGGGLCSSF